MSTYAKNIRTDIKLLTDEPSDIDNIGFEKHANLLGSILLNSSPKFNIGIFGEWGSGKTTLMKMIENVLNEVPEVVTIWFSAWMYDREKGSIVLPLLKTMSEKINSIDKSLKDHDKWKRVKNGIDNTFNALLESTSISIDAPFVSSTTDLSKMRSFLSTKNLGDKVTYYNAMQYLRKSLLDLRTKKGDRYRIVFFIDDLDRCFPDRALSIIESIKSFFDLDGIIFVISLNAQSINMIVQKKFGPHIDGFGYMEKIIQLRYIIPQWTKEDIGEFLEHIVNKIEDSNVKKELVKDENLNLMLSIVNPNPRDVKRFLNSVLLAVASSNKPISELIAVQGLIYRKEWGDFLSLMLENSKRKEFLEQYLKNMDETYVKKDMGVINERLRKFLDSGGAAVLHSIPDMTYHLRALSLSIDIGEELLSRIEAGGPSAKVIIDTDEPVRVNSPFSDYTKRISEVIVKSKGGFNIGIVGAWGTGKTTLMRQIEHTLEEKDIFTVWIDILKTDIRNEQDFLLLIGRAIMLSKFRLQSRSSQIKSFDFLSSDKITPDELTKIITSLDINKIVVLIEGLDRSSDRTIITVLESIAQLSSLNSLIMVIGFYEKMLLQAISTYRPEVVADTYMKKIFQVSLNVPRLDEESSRKFVEELLNTKSDHLNIKKDPRLGNIIIEAKDLLIKAVELEPERINIFVDDLLQTLDIQEFQRNPEK